MDQAWEPEFSQQDYHILKKETCYSGYCPVIRYSLQFKLFNGGLSHVVQRELVQRPPAVAVLLYDPRQDTVILIEQIRVAAFADPASPWLLEVVAGQVDAGESFEDCARREAIEEAGCQIEALIPICQYWASPGISDEKTIVYCGITVAEQSSAFAGLQEDGEDIKVHRLPALASLALLQAGKITSASAVIALQWLALNRQRLIDGA